MSSESNGNQNHMHGGGSSLSEARGRPQSWEIRPGIGLGYLVFGMSEEEAVLRLGAGGDRLVYEGGDVHIDFDVEGLTLFFGADEGGVLDGIEVDARCQCTIWGAKPWSLSRIELLQLISKKSGIPLRDLDLLARIGTDGEHSVALRDLSLDFYLGESGLVSSIHWSVIVDSSDEVVWPI